MASGQAWVTGTGLVAEAALEGPMRTEVDYPHDMGCPSGGDNLASVDGPADTLLPPMSPRMHYQTSGSMSSSNCQQFPA